MTFLKNTLARYPLLMGLAVILGLAASDAGAKVGFQAELSSAPNIVSNFDDRPNRFSVALQPMSEPILSRRPLPYQLKLVTASFADNALIFSTSTAGRDSLITLSVDAKNYNSYRSTRLEHEHYDKNFRQAFLKSSKAGKREGVNFGVALPKRFNEIFGEGGGNLSVRGHRRISFAGRSQWTDANSEATNQSKFPALTMEQNYRLEITGTIGSKITVKVSEDSRSTTPLANRIMIRYKGDEDDILKTVEAGNTNLSLPRSKFVGYSSRIQGLFGVKAEAQVGRLSLTVIASQEKGSAEKAKISAAGGQQGADYRRDNQYQEGRIFDIGPDSAMFSELQGINFPHWDLPEFRMFGPNDKVKKIEIYEFENDKKNPDALNCHLFIDPRDSSYRTTLQEEVKMVQLDQSLYTVYEEPDKNSHYILFNSPRYSRNALGMYLIIERENGDEDTIGTIDNYVTDSAGTKLEPILMTLRTMEGIADPDYEPWWYVWRNVYRIPKNTPAEELKIAIKKGKADTEETGQNPSAQEVNGTSEGEFIKILGLDQYDAQGELGADGKIDDRIDVFRADLGLLIFPSRFPFNTNKTYGEGGDAMPPLVARVPGIYTSKKISEKVKASEYYIQIATTTRSRDHNLRSNIIEGSERVTLNGQLLKKDQDYTIQYEYGRLSLLNDDALDPNAELEIEFEFAPFSAGAVQKKTLLGMRAEYEWSKDLKFGSTILYKSDKQADRKPKVGMETAEMTIYDFDMAFTLRPGFLTKAVNALPLVTTESVSSINVVGEVAQSHPNPNVDNVAYVDDFEASHEELSFGTSRSNWRKSAWPGHISATEYQPGKLLWHQLRSTIPYSDAYNITDAQNQGNFRPFRMIFIPDTTDQKASWAGITRYFGNRIDESRAQVIELRVKGNHGILHLDFGRISEDQNGNGKNDTEDINDNGYVEDYEDIGLDGLADPDEDTLNYDADTLPDPNGDNYFFDPEADTSVYYDHLNGTEGNISDAAFLGRPDEERLSSQGFKKTNSYFSFEIDLANVDCDNTFLECGSYDELVANPWKTYRIPIGDPRLVSAEFFDEGGEPSWDDVSHVRMWFSADQFADPNQRDVLEVASWHVVQSNWQGSLRTDQGALTTSSSFSVATVSTEDLTFDPPDEVSAPVDPNTNREEIQRGLAMIYNDLQKGDTCLAEKRLLAVEKYAGYRTLEMYVHGDEVMINDSVRFSFRFGRDSTTFYEYTTGTRVFADWSTANHVKVDFDALTALKDSLQQNLEEGSTFAKIDASVGNYRVKGDPNLNEISYFAAVVTNPDETRPVSGRIWLDELRVTNVRRDVGTAARVSLSGNLADLINYSFSFDHKDAFFRGISTATRGGGNNSLGSGSTRQAMNWSATLSLHKFFPRSLGMSLPISVSYSKSTTTPILRSRSDIVLPEETREKERTISESKSFRVSESFKHKGSNPIFDIFLNRQKLSFSYNQSHTTSPTRPFALGENYNFNGEYDASWRTSPRVPIFFFLKSIPVLKMASGTTLGIYPVSWKFTGKFNRTLSLSDDINLKRTSSLRRSLNGDMRMKYDLFQNLPITFSFTTKRDLTDPETVNFSFNPSKLKLGKETSYRQNFSFQYNPGMIPWLSTKYGYSSSYNESYSQATKSRKSDFSQSWDINGSFQHQALLGGKTRANAGGRRSSTPRRAVRGGGATEEKKEEKGKPFYEPVLAGLRFMTGWLNPVAYKYSQSYKNSLPGMLSRPSWTYRLGFTRSADVGTTFDSRPPAADESRAYEVSSGFTLLGGILTTIKYRRGISRDLVRQGTRFKKTTTAWPSLTIRIQKFTKFPLFKEELNKFIEVFSPKTSYSRDSREEYNITEGFVTSKSENVSHSPLIGVNFKLFTALSFSGTYNLTKSNATRFQSTTGSLVSETRSATRRLSFSANYSFSSPGGISIPLLGKLKFKSKVDISLRVSRNASNSEKRDAVGGWIPFEDKTDFSVGPTIGYSFSTKVKGGLSGRWQDSSDNMAHRKSHVREIQLWAEIRF